MFQSRVVATIFIFLTFNEFMDRFEQLRVLHDIPLDLQRGSNEGNTQKLSSTLLCKYLTQILSQIVVSGCGYWNYSELIHLGVSEVGTAAE